MRFVLGNLTSIKHPCDPTQASLKKQANLVHPGVKRLCTNKAEVVNKDLCWVMST